MGRLIHHFRWPILLLWLAIAFLLAAFAPSPDKTPGETTDLLPPTTPVHIALTKLADHFGDKSALSNIVIVFQRESSPLTENDLSQIESIATQIAQPQPTDLPTTDLKSLSIHSPANFALAGKSNPLIAADQKAALIFITLPYNYTTKPAARLVEHAQQIIAQQKFPPGLTAAVTGSAGYGHDYARAIEHSHQKTLTVTLISLILILLFVYRAPIAAAIPLAAIGIAALAVFSLLALLGPLGVEIGTAEQIFTFVLLYGAGVDYSLLFMSRYRELIELGTPHSASITAALNDSLPAIYSSAAMTIAGLSMLYFARFAVFHNSGPSVVLAVAAAALAATTLTPALLAIIGPHAFWPTHHHHHKSNRRLWPAIAKVVVNHPTLIFLATLALLLPPAIRGLKIPWSYDALYSLKQTYPARQGADIIQSHWPIGEIGPVTLLAISPEPQSLENWSTTTTQIIEKLKSLPNIADIRALTQPLGSSPSATENAAILLLNQEKIRTEFLSNDNQAMRLQIILTTPPLSQLAMQTAPTITAAAQSATTTNTTIYLTGTTAEMIDIRSTVQSDFTRVASLTLTAILIVVLLVLRDPLISIFILAATLLSYFATVGLTLWFFQLLGAHGLESRVQMLLFMVLVAVGQDYSIFFAVRLAQESKNLPAKPATERALIFTGPVISSCGLIMAATLGSIMAGDVQTLIQLGFAFALGMLIDTFLVRPLLLPSFVILTGRTLKHAAVASHAPTPSSSTLH